MPPIRVNLSKVTTFDPIPAGVYPVEVTAVETRDGSGEYPYLNWTLEVTDGEYAGRKLWTITSFSPKAAFKIKETLIAFGEDEKVISGDEGFELDPDHYVGAVCLATVVQESYNGQMRNRVDSLSPSKTAKAASKGPKIR